jgi:hypothetical protein
MRPNKLESLPLEILSSQVLEFERKARANPIVEDLSYASFLGKLLVLPANVRLDWKANARYKHSSLFGHVINIEEKKFYNIHTSCQNLNWHNIYAIWGSAKQTGDYLKVVWADFSALSLAVFLL